MFFYGLVSQISGRLAGLGFNYYTSEQGLNLSAGVIERLELHFTQRRYGPEKISSINQDANVAAASLDVDWAEQLATSAVVDGQYQEMKYISGRGWGDDIRAGQGLRLGPGGGYGI